VTVATAEGHVANSSDRLAEGLGCDQREHIAESRHARHAISDLAHLLMADEQVFYARWPRTAATRHDGPYP
jgi:hypothetical protein